MRGARPRRARGAVQGALPAETIRAPAASSRGSALRRGAAGTGPPVRRSPRPPSGEARRYGYRSVTRKSVRLRLGEVAHGGDAERLEPRRRAPGREAGEPEQHGDTKRSVRCRPRRGGSAGIARTRRTSVIAGAAARGRLDRDVDGVSGGADEAGERPADEARERGELGVGAHPGGEEPVERRGSRPSTSTMSQTIGRDRRATIADQSVSQTRCGKQSGSRSSTSSRDRRRSSPVSTRTGWCGTRSGRQDAGRVGARVAVGEEEEVARRAGRRSRSRRRRGRAARAAMRPRTRQTNQPRIPTTTSARSALDARTRRLLGAGVRTSEGRGTEPASAEAKRRAGRARRSRIATVQRRCGAAGSISTSTA